MTCQWHLQMRAAVEGEIPSSLKLATRASLLNTQSVGKLQIPSFQMLQMEPARRPNDHLSLSGCNPRYAAAHAYSPSRTRHVPFLCHMVHHYRVLCGSWRFSGIAHQDQVQPLQWQWQNYSFRELAPRNNPSSSLLSWQSMKTKACDSSPEADYILLACE